VSNLCLKIVTSLAENQMQYFSNTVLEHYPYTPFFHFLEYGLIFYVYILRKFVHSGISKSKEEKFVINYRNIHRNSL